MKSWWLFGLLFVFLASALICGGCADPATDAKQPDETPPSDDDDSSDDDDDDTATPEFDPVDEVNPFIGTGGAFWGMGAMMPGPLAPNGLVKLTPDTAMGSVYISYFHAGGYWYPDNAVRGISHTHLPGTGIADLGNVSVMPVMGISDERVSMPGYRSRFRHETEVARPGYYKVHLDRFDIDVELTATENVGYHRWTFPTGDDAPAPYAVIDVSYSIVRFTSWWGRVWLDPERNEVCGFTYQAGGFSRRYLGMPIHFVARFSEPILDFGAFRLSLIHI